MAAILRKIWQLCDGFNEHAQTQYAEGLPLYLHPITVALILVTYLAFVYKWGPQFMENRKPFQLKPVMIAYNGFQVAVNSYIFIFICVGIVRHGGHILACVKDEASLVPFTLYYFINKISDLFETIIFVLRKKTKQISFLHVYHHVVVIIAAYFTVITDPGGHASLPSALNAMVHTLMYGYYLVSILAGAGFEIVSFKKRITQIQMFQFCILIYHFGRGALSYCSFNTILGTAGVIQNTFMLCLFLDFYIRTYIRKRISVLEQK